MTHRKLAIQLSLTVIISSQTLKKIAQLIFGLSLIQTTFTILKSIQLTLIVNCEYI